MRAPAPSHLRPLSRLRPLSHLAALLLLAGALNAQQVWTSLDTSPAGTPAEVLLDGSASTTADSFFDVFIHGYWTETVTPGDGFTYQRVTVPGLGRIGQQGAPDLPVARLRLAVSNTATSMNLVSVTNLLPHSVALLPYPFVIQENDEVIDPTEDPGPGDPDGSPEVFVKDAGVYGSTASFPGTAATASASVKLWLSSLPHADVEIFPGSFNPNSGVLSLSAHLRVHFSASGVTQAFPVMTRDRGLLAAATFANWPEHAPAFPLASADFAGDYLVVTPAEYLFTLEPFLEHKQAQGFDVNVFTLETLAFVSCGNIRGAIDTWYQAGDPWSDRYVLLVGDASVLPQCPSPTIDQYLGDDLYGSPSDGDLDEEVFVGRLSVDNAADLAHQIAKIIGYQTSVSATHLDEVLLVAHKEDAPGKYQGSHELVAAASYAAPPSFEKIYGATPGADNFDVRAAITAGIGLLAYRGHGTTSTWSDWSLSGSFHKNEIQSLSANVDPFVVWAIDCSNSNIAQGGAEDSIAEAWMEGPGGRAVAHYGSTDVSGTSQNHVLDQRLFEAVYDKGIVRHGQAIAWAESQMAAAEPGGNSWMYMLLGDPSMRIRRNPPKTLILEAPSEIPVCPTGGGGCSLVVRVVDSLGVPQPGVLVTAVQHADAGQQPYFKAEAYTDGSGIATLPGGPGSVQAPIDMQGSDPDGNEADGIMGVVGGAWTTFGGAKAGTKGKPEFVGDGPLSGGSMAALVLEDGRNNALAGLFISSGPSTPVPFKCGTLKAFPILIDPIIFPLDGQGEAHLSTQWPNGVPPDSEFWFQIAISDPAALCGVAMSNAVRAITP